jgi:hypothetical protein
MGIVWQTIFRHGTVRQHSGDSIISFGWLCADGAAG